MKNVTNVLDEYSGVLSQAALAYEGLSKKSMIFGVNSSYTNVDALTVENGRFFTKSEDESLSRVIVLGSGVKDAFFAEHEDPIGKFLRINNANYQIIGVAAKRGAAGFFDRDNIVLMPLRSVQKLIAGIDHVAMIVVKMEHPELAADTKLDIEDLMRERHRITDPDKDDFVVNTVAETRDLVGKIIAGIQVLLIALASISLMVGGVGIMNIMYVSVSERTYEIGLRKAVGARNRDILMQFIFESIIITLIGGAVGIALGAGISYLISVIATASGFAWPFIITPQSIFLSVGFSFFVGLIFGLYPARKASKLEPITALRYE
jgi:putative ABC transport system permease protein